jgi:hypothetical protein
MTIEQPYDAWKSSGPEYPGDEIDDREDDATVKAATYNVVNGPITPFASSPFAHDLSLASPIELGSMRNAIDAELLRRKSSLQNELNATLRIISGHVNDMAGTKRVRMTRSDAGKARGPRKNKQVTP